MYTGGHIATIAEEKWAAADAERKRAAALIMRWLRDNITNYIEADENDVDRMIEDIGKKFGIHRP